MDPGSVNFTPDNDDIGGKAGRHRINPEDHVRYVLDFAARHRLHPDFAIYEPGFLRAGAALARAAAHRFRSTASCSATRSRSAFRPSLCAIGPIWRCWRKRPGAPWMIAGVSADIRPLIGETVARGGHIRVGLEDAPLGTKASNLEMVEEAVRMVREYGGEPASPVRCGRRWRAMVHSVATQWPRLFQ